MRHPKSTGEMAEMMEISSRTRTENQLGAAGPHRRFIQNIIRVDSRSQTCGWTLLAVAVFMLTVALQVTAACPFSLTILMVHAELAGREGSFPSGHSNSQLSVPVFLCVPRISPASAPSAE